MDFEGKMFAGEPKLRLHFTPSEKLYLQELVVDNKDILDNSDTGAFATRNKNLTWMEITKQFNAVENHTKRTVKQLRKAWDNLKSRRKAELARVQRESMVTGSALLDMFVKDDPSDGLHPSIRLKSAADLWPSPKKSSETMQLIKEKSFTLIPRRKSQGDEEECCEPKLLDSSLSDHAMPSSSTSTPQSPRELSRLTNIVSCQEEDFRCTRISKQTEHDEVLHALLKKEMEVKIAINEVELQMKEEELVHRRKVWELELKSLTRKLSE